MRKLASRVTDKLMADLVRQVIGTLKKIHARYPEFRHNDLHLGNIYVDDTKAKPRFMIADFGLSRLTTSGSNPVVNRNTYRNVGITPMSSYKYDLHFFLNSLREEIKSGLPETRAFLNRMLPEGYRGYNSTHVKTFRLKAGGLNTGLPTFAQILSDPFVSGRSSPRRTRSSESPNLSTGAMFRSPTPRRRTSLNNNTRGRLSAVMSNRSGRNAADIASNALANLPGVSVSTTGRRPTAAEFLRMSPRSRAAFAVRPRGGTNSRSVVVRNVARTRGANIVRETTRRVAVPRTYLPIAGPGRNLSTRPKPLTKEEEERLRAMFPPENASSSGRRPKTSPTRLAARGVVNQAVRRVIARHSPTRAAARNIVSGAIRRVIARNARNRAAAPAPPIPAMTYSERTRLARATAAAHRAAGRNARARAPRAARTVSRTVVPPARAPAAPRVSPTRGNLSNARAHSILNGYANAMNNQRILTRRMLKTKLTSVGYAANSAETHARSWEAKWIASRASANSAMKNLKAGRNLAKRGYTANVAAVARRRVALGLHKGPNGRVRKYGNATGRGTAMLLASKKKPELVAMAQRHGIAGASAMTKDQLVNALYG
jgi:hypothetical protein